ncbi:MAG: hypothetical protein AAB583_05925 [Patescibacteria group bacterium]
MKEFRKGHEKFQRRIVASFSSAQLVRIKEQMATMDLENEGDLKDAIGATEPDPKKALRLHYGISVITAIYNTGNTSLDGFHNVLIWKTGPEETDLMAEWRYYERSTFKVPKGFKR